MLDVTQTIQREFRERGGVELLSISVRPYPEETNYIVFVKEEDFHRAAEIGNELDSIISSETNRAFIVVRRAPKEMTSDSKSDPMVDGVQDPRATELVRLISSRSRVSEVQPSLSYIRDIRSSIAAITTGRHHLVFGRRGAGKTALLVEAKQQVEREGSLSCWVNIQTLRNEPADRVFLYVLEEILTTVATRQQEIRPESLISVMAVEVFDEVRRLLGQRETETVDAQRLIPRVSRLLRRFLEQSGNALYIFLDDFYYLPRHDQPRVLDMLNSCIRDCEAWLKVASIRHLTRWFQSSPPMGLQTIQDADLIDLDVTLQDPKRAKSFLESILLEYARHVGVTNLTKLFHGKALDRLVLASGAVPRDYLVLASDTIVKAQRRASAKLVGAQEVNQAAGDAAQVKIQELEEDMASNLQVAERTVRALSIVRDFCLNEKSYTYFLVDFRDKEVHPELYSVLTDLMDVRLIHVIDPSVSNPHIAGRRSEAFMLDLSQFSGSRLKQGIQILDFQSGRIVSRRTRTGAENTKVGGTPLQVIAILRGAPSFELSRLGELIGEVTESSS
ncbi:ATP-binding protein [Pseudonocardia oceani]|uniref:ATP-binding protein n=1 Tax=Pseudonocardia oceani TaxID=2792013 RepID=UPI001C4A72EA|nr:ATP-binding protein [Pseudonocardia oceani]MBW0091426.1 ATP-binding protein [Pseudonocardia oceani]MBW0111073.1 ATP-binding protein [Pseudonocardia oceani]